MKMKIGNLDFLNCVESAKVKLKKIEAKCHPEAYNYAKDLIDRCALAIVDSIQKAEEK